MRLSKKTLENWLREKPRAKAGGLCTCPIAKCFGYARVGYDDYLTAKNKNWKLLPKWAKTFIIAIDNHAKSTSAGRDWGCITRAKALEVLKP